MTLEEKMEQPASTSNSDDAVQAPTTILKRDGRRMEFDADRIEKAITRCFQSFGREPSTAVTELTRRVVNIVAAKASRGVPSVEEVQDIVEMVLQAAGDQTSAFGGTLTSATAKLDQGLDPNALRDLMAGLAAATKEMAANNKALTDKLEETGREVVQIRASLEAARAEALTDALTGIGNRKAFDQTLQMRVDEALGTRTDLCLMLCDIDHFKKFNDTWGHQIGDQVIRFVAATLKRSALGDMLAARYGGEEFGLVMPRMKLGGARELAEFIRKQVESKALVRKSTGEDLGRISISIGLAQLRGNETVASLVERADECLYASKRGGRNRVTTDADQITLALG
jgi:diguanylate cyclase